MTSDLEEALGHPVAGGASSDIYKYKQRGVDPPVYYAVKLFRWPFMNKMTDEQAERVRGT